MVGLTLGGRDEPDLAVKAPVVEPVDVLGDGDLHVDDRLPAALGPHHRVADAFGLEQRVQRLGHGVVVAVPLGSDGCDSLGLSQSLGVANRSILDSAVAVVDQAGDVLAGSLPGPQAHVESIQRQVGPQTGRHLPTHDHPAEDVKDERDVGPARVRADVGQIGHPQLVWRRGHELPVDLVLGTLGLSAVADGGFAGLLARDPAQALGSHQPLHGAAGDLDALAVELGVDLPNAVDTQVRLVSGLDVDDQLGIADRACGRWGRVSMLTNWRGNGRVTFRHVDIEDSSGPGINSEDGCVTSGSEMRFEWCTFDVRSGYNNNPTTTAGTQHATINSGNAAAQAGTFASFVTFVNCKWLSRGAYDYRAAGGNLGVVPVPPIPPSAPPRGEWGFTPAFGVSMGYQGRLANGAPDGRNALDQRIDWGIKMWGPNGWEEGVSDREGRRAFDATGRPIYDPSVGWTPTPNISQKGFLGIE